MNIKRIDTAIKSYGDALAADDRARLDFFRALWAEAAACESELPATSCNPFSGVSDDVIRDLHAQGTPLLKEFSADVDPQLLEAAVARLVDVVIGSGAYPAEVADALAGGFWREPLRSADFSSAGSEPALFLVSVSERLSASGADEALMYVILPLVSLALRIQLEGPAAEAAKALKRVGASKPHSLTCPVCGSAPSLAHVGAETSSAGRGKALVCGQCGTVWEFERVRCACCGTRNQEHLHYRSIDGDDAHRVCECDECGGYTRTLFSEGMLGIVSYEVEDVLMVKLDAMEVSR